MQMQQTEFFMMRIDPQLQKTIDKMANDDGSKKSKFVKNLIKREAERRGLLPHTEQPTSQHGGAA